MSLSDDMRQNIQSNLDFSSSPRGEARKAGREGSESLRTTSAPESLAGTDRMMGEIVERENLKEALRRVKANKGSAGVDGMTVNRKRQTNACRTLSGCFAAQAAGVRSAKL
jgi:RNA-directed DNA polymerase